MRAGAAGDRALVGAALTGDRAAAERLSHRLADTVWTACRRMNGESEGRAVFSATLAALQADNFAGLGAYDGRSRLEIFVAIRVRDILAQPMQRLFWDDPSAGWSAFQRFFAADIERLIRRRLPGRHHGDLRRDAYQDLCLALIDDDFRRIKAYSGSGSFAGFVLHAVDRLLIDFLRSPGSRRRLPAAIARLPELEQELFRQIHWQRSAPEPRALATALAARRDPAPDAAKITAALARVAASLPRGYCPGAAGPPQLLSLSDVPEAAAPGLIEPSPEDIVLEQETDRLLALAAAAVRQVATGLPERERLYLRIALGGAEPLPAREVARVLQCPVQDIYALKRCVLRRLRDSLQDDKAVKKWLASVQAPGEFAPAPLTAAGAAP
jgi:RNA polymerase primary sigma factor